RLAGVDRVADLVLEKVELGACLLALLGGQRAERPHLLGDCALPPQRRDADCLQRRLIAGIRNAPQDFLFKGEQTHGPFPTKQRPKLEAMERAKKARPEPKSCGGSES